MKVYFNNSCKICKAEIDLYKKDDNILVKKSTEQKWLKLSLATPLDLTLGTELNTTVSTEVRKYGLWNLSGRTLKKADVSSSAYLSSVGDIALVKQQMSALKFKGQPLIKQYFSKNYNE